MSNSSNHDADTTETTPATRFQHVFDRQRAASRSNPEASLEVRLARLKKLETLLVDNQDDIAEAICKDYGHRSIHESLMLEVLGLVSNAAHTQKKIKKWMKPQKRHVGMAFAGAKNTVIPQPKGVIGIVSPWNYPLFLAFSPCISALAAGNRCVIKMAANSQNLARLMDKLISEVFDEEELALIPGISAGEFTHQPWDHLVFTGSPATAKIVMETAAKTLTPVTLELGGKSPTILCDDYSIKTAAQRISFCKYINSGQTCLAPDYMLLPRGKVDEFVSLFKEFVNSRYTSCQSEDFTSIIDQKAFDRLVNTLEDAKAKGAKVINLLGDDPIDKEKQKIPPHLILDVNDDMIVMQDEIFGPLFPVKVYDDIDEVISYINERERPLALYLYSNNKAIQDKVINNTMSGGVCLNDCILHVGQHDLPFGGIGNSGMGQYHGQEGFEEFSKLRPIFKQGPISGLLMMGPPFTKKFDQMYNAMIKYRL